MYGRRSRPFTRWHQGPACALPRADSFPPPPSARPWPIQEPITTAGPRAGKPQQRHPAVDATFLQPPICPSHFVVTQEDRLAPRRRRGAYFRDIQAAADRSPWPPRLRPVPISPRYPPAVASIVHATGHAPASIAAVLMSSSFQTPRRECILHQLPAFGCGTGAPGESPTLQASAPTAWGQQHCLTRRRGSPGRWQATQERPNRLASRLSVAAGRACSRASGQGEATPFAQVTNKKPRPRSTAGR